MKFLVGVDLGGTKINCALADLEGNVIEKHEIPTNAQDGENAVLDRIINAIEAVIEKGNKTIKDVRAIGIGAPGPLNAKTGVIIDPANLPFRNFDIVTPLKDKFEVPVYLDNDANVAAIGEFLFGAGKGKENLVYFTVSTGVGGGAILNGEIYRGRTCNALELGHTTVDPISTVRCNCGNLGCLEAFSSGTAIAKRAKEAVATNVETSLKNYDILTAAEVFKEAANGDRVAISIRDKALTYLGVGVANAINTFDPDIVVIGGGVTKVGAILFDKVKEVASERALSAIYNGCEIAQAKLGTDAGVVGAVALALLQSK
ncbi:ROK family protein [Clostridium carnis]